LGLKEIVRARTSEDRITYFAKDREVQTDWNFIKGASISAEAVVLSMDPDTYLMIPLRAVSPPEDRAAFVKAIRSWINRAAANSAQT
jgi:hypothetical protein